MTVTGLVQLIHFPAFINQEVVVMSRFDMKEMLRTMEKWRCNELWLVPRR